jgi:glycosyltransferase involved in cell wall biosynthesis
MKVLFVSGSYPPMHCGVGDYVGRLAPALSTHCGAQVSVLTSSSVGPTTSTREVGVLAALQTWSRSAVGYFDDTIRKTTPDIVHIQFPTQGYDSWSGLGVIAFSSRFRWRVPVVATLHEFLPKTTYRADRWIHALALIANRIVVVRPNYYSTIPWPLRLLIPRRKLQLIANSTVVPAVDLSETERRSIQAELGCGSAKLVAFFGFSYPHKGVDLLFRIADPAKHHLLLIGELSPQDPYHSRLLGLAESAEWKGRVTITGFIDATKAGRLLAAADAAVFPFREGGGIWNSSLHAASSQGTFTLTTSLDKSGYDPRANIYYARPGVVDEMRQALQDYQGTRGQREATADDPWRDIAVSHMKLYESLLGRRAKS